MGGATRRLVVDTAEIGAGVKGGEISAAVQKAGICRSDGLLRFVVYDELVALVIPVPLSEVKVRGMAAFRLTLLAGSIVATRSAGRFVHRPTLSGDLRPCDGVAASRRR
jgi:hypothetical protein